MFSNEIFWAVIACVTLMIFDLVTGFIGAWKNKNINSTKMREGIFNKSALVLVIMLAILCEVFIIKIPGIGVSVPLVIPACVIIITMEVISITENIAEINPTLRDSKLLQLFKKKDEE